MTVIWLGLMRLFRLKANEMVINRYLALGWERAGPRRDWA